MSFKHVWDDNIKELLFAKFLVVYNKSKLAFYPSYKQYYNIFIKYNICLSLFKLRNNKGL